MKYVAESAVKPDFLTKGCYKHPQDAQLECKSLDGYALPGIIDMHFHGAAGWDFSFGDETKIDEMMDVTAASGLTGLLATIITSPIEQMHNILRAVKNIAKYRKALPIIHGIYLEGPFISYEKRGSHPESCLLNPSIELLEEWQEACDGLIKIITVAPELPGAFDFIKKATDMGVKVALGHSAADWETAKKAVDSGACLITHMFNAMPHIHHRKPNITSFALASKSLPMEIIADCEHVSPEIVSMLLTNREQGKTMLISDSIALTNLSDGWYEFYNQTLAKTKSKALLSDGTFFGGAVMLPKSLKRLSEQSNISWGELGECVWRNPCEFLNIQPPNTQVYFDKNMNWLATEYDGVWYVPAQRA